MDYHFGLEHLFLQLFMAKTIELVYQEPFDQLFVLFVCFLPILVNIAVSWLTMDQECFVSLLLKDLKKCFAFLNFI